MQGFHSWYRREHGGARSYTWVKNQLQQAGVVKRAKARGKHRKKRERAPLPGMLVHQDVSRHEWIAGHDWDLVVTLDDATGEHLSMFFCQEEGTASSFHGVGQTVARHGLFCSLYTDRGSHYFHTPEAGGKVDRSNPTQFGRALAQLGIEHIAAYSPEARGRSERAFGTHQERLPRELAKTESRASHNPVPKNAPASPNTTLRSPFRPRNMKSSKSNGRGSDRLISRDGNSRSLIANRTIGSSCARCQVTQSRMTPAEARMDKACCSRKSKLGRNSSISFIGN